MAMFKVTALSGYKDMPSRLDMKTSDRQLVIAFAFPTFSLPSIPADALIIGQEPQRCVLPGSEL
jgi:hypothetical protein